MKRVNIIAFLIFLGALSWIFVLNPESVASIRSTFLGIFSPVIKSSGAIQQSSDQLTDNRSQKEILAELHQLRQEVARLRIKEEFAEEVRIENDSLREDLGFMSREELDVVPARIIKRTRASWWSVMTINRGSNHGIDKDFAVITEKGIVGKTTSGITGETAEVLLMTDEQCQISVRVGRQGTLHGIVRGQRGVSVLRPEVRLLYIDKNHRLPAGALLYTTGEGGVYPPDRLVGKMRMEIEEDTYKAAIVDPAVDFSDLTSVFVIIRKPGDPSTPDSEEEGDSLEE